VAGLATPVAGLRARRHAGGTEQRPAEDAHITQAQLDAFKAELAAAQADDPRGTMPSLHCSPPAPTPAPPSPKPTSASHAGQVALQAVLDALAAQLKAMGKTLEARHKQWLKLLDTAEKSLRARQSKAFDGKAAREAKRALLAADAKKNEAPTVRDRCSTR
jgi:type I restriction enzyme M protein